MSIRTATVSSDPSNTFLACLEFGDRLLLWDKLQEISVRHGTLLSRQQGGRQQVYFPCDRTILSLRTILKNGGAVECGLIGSEGIWPVCKDKWSNIDVVAFRSGRIICMDADEFEKAKQQSSALKELVATCSATLAKDSMQLAACNATHPVDQRLARWLLQMMDGAETNTLYATHDDVASVLGVGRSYVTRMLVKLSNVGALRCQRGSIEVRNADLLRGASCGCEAQMRREPPVPLFTPQKPPRFIQSKEGEDSQVQL